MESETIRRIIASQREEVRSKFARERMVKRSGLSNIERYLSHPFIFITTGLRRCGKSVLSLLIVQNKKYGYVNFDDERLKGLEASELESVLEGLYYIYGSDIDHFVLDELQNINGWELFANRLQRTNRVIITGSNANLLSKELGTHLTGRYVNFILFPFSFKEYLEFVGHDVDPYLTPSIARTKEHLKTYMRMGGIPDGLRFGEVYLRTLVGDILERDIIRRYKVRYERQLHEIASYLLSNYAREISYNKIAKISKVKSVHTVKNYVHYLEQAFLVFEVKRFSTKLKEQNLAPRKVYCIDPGIITASIFNISENQGLLMENVVAVELMRRRSMDSHLEIFYWKDHEQHEVDFVLRSGERVVELIQVTSAGSENEVRERELRALRKAQVELACDVLTVITSDLERFVEGIRFVPLWKWLLSDKSGGV